MTATCECGLVSRSLSHSLSLSVVRRRVKWEQFYAHQQGAFLNAKVRRARRP